MRTENKDRCMETMRGSGCKGLGREVEGCTVVNGFPLHNDIHNGCYNENGDAKAGGTGGKEIVGKRVAYKVLF